MYPELSATTNFTFLIGASHPEETARRAAELGLTHIAIADLNSVAGVVRAFTALKDIAREGTTAIRQSDNVGYEDVRARAARLGRNRDPKDDTPALRAGKAAARRGEDPSAAAADEPASPPPSTAADMKPKAGPEAEGAPIRSIPELIPGARLRLICGAEVTALPIDRAAWGRLTRLLTIGKRRALKGECRLTVEDLEAWREGLMLILHPPCPLAPPPEERSRRPEKNPVPRPRPAEALALLKRLARGAGRRGEVSLLLSPRYDGRDVERFA
ncbi:MAG: hypothetical protein AAF322_06075, partial [Pseudomonadota bacterium]